VDWRGPAAQETSGGFCINEFLNKIGRMSESLLVAFEKGAFTNWYHDVIMGSTWGRFVHCELIFQNKAYAAYEGHGGFLPSLQNKFSKKDWIISRLPHPKSLKNYGNHTSHARMQHPLQYARPVAVCFAGRDLCGTPSSTITLQRHGHRVCSVRRLVLLLKH